MGGLTTPALCPSNQCTDLATEQLETLAKIPSDLSYGNLRLEPRLGSAAGRSAFRKIVPPSRGKKW